MLQMRRISIVPYGGMARMLSGHQNGARRGANGIARVILGKTHAFGRQSIEMGRLDPLLPVTPQIGIAKVIGDQQDDIWRLRYGRLDTRTTQGSEEKQRQSGGECFKKGGVHYRDSF
jgi:hypothetical protein